MTTSFRARLFWIVSTVAHALYQRFPIFGPIRGSIAIIRWDDGYVMVERNDGRGIGFPGGMARFHEPPELTVRREVLEETGLTLSTAELKFKFETTQPIPCITHVFEATAAKAELRSSWEGTPRILSIAEFQQRVLPQQQRVVEYLLEHRAATEP